MDVKTHSDIEYQKRKHTSYPTIRHSSKSSLHHCLCALIFLSGVISTIGFLTVVRGCYMWYCLNATSSSQTFLKDDNLQCEIQETNRFDCWPEKVGASQEACTNRGCCWQPSSHPNTAPFCFFPTNYDGYNATDVTETSSGIEATLSRTSSSFYSQDIKLLKLKVEFQTDSRLRIKIYDPNNQRYEVPLAVPSGSSEGVNLQYKVDITKEPFSITVTRKSTGEKIFDTSGGAPLIFSDQFLQISTKLSTKFLYGLGEHRNNFLIDVASWGRYVFWNRDDVPKLNNNGYGSHPFFLNLEHAKDANTGGSQNNSHGVFLLNSNAGEVAFQPYGGGDGSEGAVTYRFLGGVLDFFVLTGPESGAITSQLVDVIGRPYIPPFWALGFHLCRWGYNSSDRLSQVVERNREAQMPYAALQPGAITYRVLGGILDLFVVTGPQAQAVVTQLADVIGRPYFPPFWSLGFHICKFGIHGADQLKAIIKRNRDAKLPYDVQWNDIDYMDSHRDWTYDHSRYKGLPDIVADLHNNHQHYIIMADPAIASSSPPGTYPPFDEGKQMDVFIKDHQGQILIGRVWPGQTAFPDFFHPNAEQYWYNQVKNFHDKIPFDGLWIDMNEPSSFVDGSINGCPKSPYNNPPYVPETIDSGSLPAKTICPSAVQNISLHYNVHNMYGWSQANVTRRVLNRVLGKRSPIISRSTFPGLAVNAGHWLGDNLSTFKEMYFSIPGILNFNLFGLPQVGADICGFRGTTTNELCTRWMQLGAFYPFMRNHNSYNSDAQDPGIFPSPYKDYMRSALQLRYSLLAVLYTAFYDAHVSGLPIVRPLMFYYNGTESIDAQFLWGDQLLISPVLTEGALSVQAYLPDDVWYDFYNGTRMPYVGQTVTLDAPLDKINVHVRGGSILPLLPPTQRTYYSRMEKFELVCGPDAQGIAQGHLFWDDGESFDTVANKNYTEVEFSMQGFNSFTSRVVQSGYKPSYGVRLGNLTLLSILDKPDNVTLNGKTPDFYYDVPRKSLTLINLDVDLTQPIEASWQ